MSAVKESRTLWCREVPCAVPVSSGWDLVDEAAGDDTRVEVGDFGFQILNEFLVKLAGLALSESQGGQDVGFGLGELALADMERGKSITQAHAEAGRALSLEALRAMLRRLRRAQSIIRTHLPGAPPPGERPDPLTQTAAHLRHLFSSEICPVGAFQLAFKRPLPA